jgi:hypothetical protein
MRTQGSLVPSYALLCSYAQLGDRDAAFALLDELIGSRSGQAVFCSVDAVLDPIRDDPRFDRLLRRLALPATTAR